MLYTQIICRNSIYIGTSSISHDNIYLTSGMKISPRPQIEQILLFQLNNSNSYSRIMDQKKSQRNIRTSSKMMDSIIEQVLEN